MKIIFIVMRESQIVPWGDQTSCTPICAFSSYDEAEIVEREENRKAKGTSDRFYIQECEIK